MAVRREEADLLSRALGCRLIRTSVKEDVNVNAVFRHLAACCLQEMRQQDDDYAMNGNGLHPLTISESKSQTSIKKYCNGEEDFILFCFFC